MAKSQDHDANTGKARDSNLIAEATAQPSIQIIQSGKPIQLSANVTLNADEKAPFLVLTSANKQSANELELSREATIWDSGVEFTLVVLGKQDSGADGAQAYAVQIDKKKAARPSIAQSAKSSFKRSDDHFVSMQKGWNFYPLSHTPLVIVGLSRNDDVSVITNFGSSSVGNQLLLPKAIYFMKADGKTIQVPFNEKKGDYDIPEDQKSRGTSRGAVAGPSSATVKCGPAEIIVTRTHYSRDEVMSFGEYNKNSVDVNIQNFDDYKGPILVSYKLPDQATATKGLNVFIAPPPVAQKSFESYSKPDSDFKEYWTLTLSPPIVVEYGLGPQGVLTDAADFHFQLWKFGNRIFGEAGYEYSDTTSWARGIVDGTIENGELKLNIVGSPSLSLSSKSVNTDSITGTAKVSGKIPGGGYAPQPKEAVRSFTLKTEEKPPTMWHYYDTFKVTSEQLASIPPNTKFWNALAATPGDASRESVVRETIRLLKAEEQERDHVSPMSPDYFEVNSQISALARVHYSAWESASAQRGPSHPITKAHAELAENLYMQLLNAPGSRLSANDYVVKDLVALLQGTNRTADAKRIEDQVASRNAQSR